MRYLDLKRINEPYEHAADEVLRSGWYLRGEATRLFEQHYAEYIGTEHCIGCGNGLDALTLIFRAYKELGVMKDGDEVIVPANTYIASILAITENNLVPVLVEPDITTLQIDDTLIEQSVSPRTRAIMIVHLYGRCAYTERIGDICRRHGLKLIEDNAQSHGCTYLPPREETYLLPHSTFHIPRKTASLGHAAAHSFYPTKNLGAFGDAGAVTTDDADLAGLIRSLGNYGSARHYVFDHIGRNSRMDEIQAAILDAKLHDLDTNNERRREIANIYNKVENPLINIPRCNRDSVYHIFPVLSPRRDDLRQYLADHDVQTEIHYPIPPHKQACYKEWNSLSLPVTEMIHAQELSIPCNQAMTNEEVERIVDLLNDFR
jgi:dTDP-4-amino-4,6-dideoxygalactose transaminase